jgi:hypothetical protein
MRKRGETKENIEKENQRRENKRKREEKKTTAPPSRVVLLF